MARGLCSCWVHQSLALRHAFWAAYCHWLYAYTLQPRHKQPRCLPSHYPMAPSHWPLHQPATTREGKQSQQKPAGDEDEPSRTSSTWSATAAANSVQDGPVVEVPWAPGSQGCFMLLHLLAPGGSGSKLQLVSDSQSLCRFCSQLGRGSKLECSLRPTEPATAAALARVCGGRTMSICQPGLLPAAAPAGA